jgi:flagellar M-ring protein FliF
MSRAQLASLAGAFLVVVGVIAGSALWVSTPTYRVLFSDMDAESAAQVSQKLRERKVGYELADGGRTLLVPERDIDQLRIDLASQGLPASGRIGFEIFDRTQFGATEFLEQVNYRRALEGEIARTIATISDVASARVHIAMSKDSLFGTRQQPAKASVVLKLRAPNRPLSASSIGGITSLVAASVEGLRPEHVVVMDSFGRPLSRQAEDADEPLGALHVERQQRFEKDLASRVVSLLEPVVGRDRVRVNVAARLNADTEDRLEERWDTEGVVRSRAVQQEGSTAPYAGGIAGARANVPAPVPAGSNTPAAPSLADASLVVPAAGATRSSETTNYEVGKIVRHTVRPRGDVARLSVAVIVDDDRSAKKGADGRLVHASRPRDPAELQKIQGLVSAAVGFDPGRGDQVTVENISFDEPVEEPMGEPGFLERHATHLRDGGRLVTVLLLGLAAIVFIARPLLGRGLARLAPAPPPALGPQQLPRTIQELEGEIEAQLDAAAAAKMGDRKLPVLTKRVLGIARAEPESAARLVRTWLVEDRKS